MWRKLQGAGLEWGLCDLPFFALGSNAYIDTFVLLEFERGLTEELNGNLPFVNTIGWYPFVRIYGICHFPHSPRYQVPTIKVSFLEYRTAGDIIQRQDDVERLGTPTRVIEGVGTSFDPSNVYDKITFLHLVNILLYAANLNIDDLPEKLLSIYKGVSESLEPEYTRLLPIRVADNEIARRSKLYMASNSDEVKKDGRS
jgi:hypothetical protein